jgi:hypothetical protein
MNQENRFEDFIANSNKYFIEKLPSGDTNSVEEFYKNVILINSPDKDIVEKWHQLLMEYVNDREAVFFIRRYASDSNNDWTMIRRGFLTEYDSGLKYVFCDNYFAHYFFMMAMQGIVPSYNDFKSIILNRKLPYGYMVTKEELPYQAYQKGKSVNINMAGWKLDHINSVNENYSFDYKNENKILFPKGEQSHWTKKSGDDFCTRKIDPAEIKNHKEKVIAHFLRLVHPMNYFLTPQKKNCTYDVGGSHEMIEFVRNKKREKYGKLYEEFEKLIYVGTTGSPSLSFNYIVKYGFKINKKTKSIKTKKEILPKKEKFKYIKDLDNNDINIIKAYLIYGKSFRMIEREIMGIDSQERGGGFKSKKIINSYGLKKEHKGLINEANINQEIEKSEGDLKKILESIKSELLCN